MPANTTPIDWKNLHTLTEQQFPDFLRTDGPNLVAFLKAYYEWLDQQDNPNYSLRNFQHWRDIDRTLDKFVDWFHNEFMIRIPKDVIVNRRLLTKYISDFYRAKGTQKAYNLLFRILYGEEIDFYYPAVDMMRFNHPAWVVERSLKTTGMVPEAQIFDCIGEQIIGSASKARSRVERIERKVDNNAIVYEMFISKTVGTWSESDIVICDGVNIATINSGGVFTYAGKYLEDAGADGTKKIQDSWYYQEYSYVIKSGQSVDVYRDIVKQLVHPAGTKMFGEVQVVLDFEAFAPDVAFEPYTLSFDTSVINQIPQVITNLVFDDPDNAEFFKLVIELLTPLIAATTKSDAYTYSTQFDTLTGFFGINASNNKLVEGVGTAWETELSGIDRAIVFDGSGTYSNGLYLVQNITSANTAVIAQGFHDTSSANLYFIPQLPHPCGAPLTGFARVANTGVMSEYSEYPITAFEGWSPENFTDGKGYLGTGTNWKATFDALSISTILIQDGSGTYSNRFFNLRSKDSANTMTTEVPYFSTSSSNLFIYTN